MDLRKMNKKEMLEIVGKNFDTTIKLIEILRILSDDQTNWKVIIETKKEAKNIVDSFYKSLNKAADNE